MQNWVSWINPVRPDARVSGWGILSCAVDDVEPHLPVFLEIQRGGAFSVAYGAREFPTCTSCKKKEKWMKKYPRKVGNHNDNFNTIIAQSHHHRPRRSHHFGTLPLSPSESHRAPHLTSLIHFPPRPHTHTHTHTHTHRLSWPRW